MRERSPIGPTHEKNVIRAPGAVGQAHAAAPQAPERKNAKLVSDGAKSFTSD